MPRGATFRVETVAAFEVEECYSCGVEFGITKYQIDQLRRSKRTFFCPNGHGQSYTGKSDETLRREAEARADEAYALAQQKQRELDGALRTIAKVKADAKATAQRVAKRVDAGVCLHCQRSFQNVARHMYRMHDVENGAEAVDKLAAKASG